MHFKFHWSINRKRSDLNTEYIYLRVEKEKNIKKCTGLHCSGSGLGCVMDVIGKFKVLGKQEYGCQEFLSSHHALHEMLHVHISHFG